MASQWLGAASPPQGTTANFVNPEDHMVQNSTLHAVCLGLVTVFVAMRLYTRRHIIKTALGADDYCCILSYCLSVLFSGLALKSYTLGIGRHAWDVPLVWLPFGLKFFTIAVQVFMLLSGFVKLTLLFSYRCMLSPEAKTRYLVNCAIAFILCLHTGLYFASLFGCRPIERFWDSSVAGTCFHPLIIPYLSGVSSCVMDFYILLLPLPVVWSLNISLAWKLKVLAVASLGLLACIASTVRLALTPRLQTNGDITWILSEISVWGLIEVNVGILCACFMLLPAFLSHVVPPRARSFFCRLCSCLPGPPLRCNTETLSLGIRGQKSWTQCRYDATCVGQYYYSSNRIHRHQSFSINSIRTPQDGASNSSTAGKNSIRDSCTTAPSKAFDVP